MLDHYGPTDLRMKATDHNVNGASTVARLLGGWPDEKPDLARDASPITFVAKGDPPFMIMHGEQDPVVPVSQSRSLFDALISAGDKATLKTFPTAAHGGREFSSPETLQAELDFFNKALKP